MKFKYCLLCSVLVILLSGCSDNFSDSNDLNDSDLKSVQKYGVVFNEDNKGNIVNYDLNGIDSMSSIKDVEEILVQLESLNSYIHLNKLNFINNINIFYKVEDKEGYYFLLIDLKSPIDSSVLSELNLISNHMMTEYTVYERGVSKYSIGSTKYLGKKVYDVLYTVNNNNPSYIPGTYVIGNSSVELFNNFSAKLSIKEYDNFLKYSINLKEGTIIDN